MKVKIFDIQRFADISNSKSNTVVTGTADADNISNDAENVTIQALGGDDKIMVSPTYIFLNGYNPYNFINNAVIYGGDGNDSVYSRADYVTINGGTGDDTIDFKGNNNVYQYSGGNDIVSGFEYKDTLQVNGNYTTEVNGNDFIVKVGNGSVTFKDAKYTKFYVPDSAGNLTIPNDFKVISGTDDADTLENNYNGDIRIEGLGGDDSIRNAGSNVTIDGGAGDDTINNSGNNVTITGGTGDDTINFYGNNNVYQYSGGNDTVSGFEYKDTLQVNGNYTTEVNGNDFIVKVGNGSVTLKDANNIKFYIADSAGNLTMPNDWTVISGTDDADTLKNNYNGDIRIEGLGGNDDIYNSGKNVTIDGGEGNDTIYNSSYGDSVMVYGGNGNDSIKNDGDNVTIEGGNGDDTIYNPYGDNAMVYGDAGNDTIKNYGDTVTVDGGEGNDTIYNSGSDVTITGGIGDDTINNSGGDNVTIDGGEGNDTIYNSSYGDNVMVYGGEGNDSIENSSENVTIDAGNGDDTIHNSYGDSVTVDGGDGADYIYNGHYTRSNYGLTDDDYNSSYDISDNYGESYMPAPSFSYNETIYGGHAMLNGGAGNDTIETEGSNSVTLNGGEGDDLLIGGNSIAYSKSTTTPGYNHIEDLPIAFNQHGNDVFLYHSGNDTVTNFKSNDTLSFAANYTGFDFAANDLILYAAEGSLRITDAKNKLVEVADGKDNLIAHAFFANGYEGVMDGRSFSGFEVIQGSDNLSNQIYAGESGSSLYGGFGANDDLYGNVGADEFVYKYGDGQDNFYNIGAEDVVNLNGVNIEQIATAEITDGGVIASFKDGGGLTIHGHAGTFILSGQRFGADYQNKTFYAK